MSNLQAVKLILDAIGSAHLTLQSLVLQTFVEHGIWLFSFSVLTAPVVRCKGGPGREFRTEGWLVSSPGNPLKKNFFFWDVT
jgi:hypothetical protein